MSTNMKSRGRRFIFCIASIILSASMVLTMMPSAAYAAASSSGGNTLTRGEFTFAPHLIENKDLKDDYIYSDDYFNGSGYAYNAHLATMSMILASASISSHEETYANKSRNIKNLLSDLDFSDIEVNKAYTEKMTEQSMGVAVAHKGIKTSGGDATLLVLVPRSAGYEKEWAGDFTVGKSGLHEGFRLARDQVVDFTKEYVKKYNISGNVKVWTMGYSRGAGTANLVGGEIVDEPDCLGVNVKPEDLYDYSFGTPKGVTKDMDPANAKYKNIHNIFADYDPVAMAAFSQWGFSRYGTDKLLPVHNAAAKKQMLKFLKVTNKKLYAYYTKKGSGQDPDDFSPKIVSLKGGLKFVNDTSSDNPAEKTQKDFLQGRISFLASTIMPDRETYTDKYQYMIQKFTGYYLALNDADTTKFVNGVASCSDAKIAALMMYGYYISTQIESSPSNAKTLLEQMDSIESSIKSDADVASWLENNKTYSSFKAALKEASEGKGSESFSEITAQLKGIASDELGTAIKAGMSAQGADSSLISLMTDSKVTVPMVEFASYALFGSKGESFNPFSLKNDQLRIAATLIGTSGAYLRVHNNEIILSWLRTQDSYYRHSIKASAGKGGTISSRGKTAVTDRSSKTYRIKARSGCTIRNVKVDGKSLGAKKTYTFRRIIKDHSISAVFATLSPKDVKAKTWGMCRIHVTWNKVKGAKKYKIYRSSSKSGKYRYVSASKLPSGTVYGLKYAKRYWFKVKAVGRAGTSAYSIAGSAISY